MELILASNSPRRKELLKENSFNFTVVPSSFEESDNNNFPEKTVKKNALGKAQEVFNKIKEKSQKIVLGADTVVCFENKILGKPKNKQEAKEMLKKLSGKSHKVLTGYAIIGQNFSLVDVEQSIVVFNKLSEQTIDEYVATGKPLDKAGAYGIQDEFPIVKKFVGSYNNIVGLPIEVFKNTLIDLLNK